MYRKGLCQNWHQNLGGRDTEKGGGELIICEMGPPHDILGACAVLVLRIVVTVHSAIMCEFQITHLLSKRAPDWRVETNHSIKSPHIMISSTHIDIAIAFIVSIIMYVPMNWPLESCDR